MNRLRNIYDSKTLTVRLQQEPFQRVTLSFYRYVKIENPSAFRDDLYRAFSSLGVLGRIYIANEGINAQISVPENTFSAFQEYLNGHQKFSGVPLKIAVEDNRFSFIKLKIKVRNKILADGLHDESFDVTKTGRHLSAVEFNSAMESPDTIVVDMRNNYESEVGHFKGAVLPNQETFKETLPKVVEMLSEKKNNKILLYCTGGIRCEKASAYLKHVGFTDVNQLEGGIIQYAHQAHEKNLETKFIGKNFVFDDRLGERITNDIISHCHRCGKKSDTHRNCANVQCHELFIQCENCFIEMHGCHSDECKMILEANLTG
jgi:UPF0176 protein